MAPGKLSPPTETKCHIKRLPEIPGKMEVPMRGILLWLLGIPIPIIILLYLFGVL
jgi:hypothetical protein